MPNYHVTIDGREYSISLEGGQVLIDGQAVDGSLVKLNDAGLYVLSREKEALELYLQRLDAGALEITLNGQMHVARVETPQTRARKNSEEPAAGAVPAPIPGVVVEVCVQEGERVEAGQTVVVLESMKMQMKIRAPAAGLVSRVGVQPGNQVEKGALLARIEVSGEAEMG